MTRCANSRMTDDAFGLPLLLMRHREEAAFGAALTVSVGAGIFASLEEACFSIEYET
jgi:hypothetical protein